MNPITTRVNVGTLGELFVQLELLRFGIQSSTPLKDSGNDLIAIRAEVFKALQIKTCHKGSFPTSLLKLNDILFHLLAIVIIPNDQEISNLDWSKIKVYIVKKGDDYSKENIIKDENLLTITRVNDLFI